MTKKIKYFIFTLLLLLLTYKLYQYIPYRIEYLGHYDKIWAHRNNSIEKAKIASKYFDGLELDLVFNENENVLDVNHPPIKSIHLNFADYMVELKKQPKLWLDIKNLNETNAKLIFNKLIKILNTNNYTVNDVLIETRFPEALPVFAKNGFKTIYYLPYGLSKMNAKELNQKIKIIKSILKTQPNIGISSNYEDYNIIREHFPNNKKYLWIIDGLRHRNYTITNKIFNDTMVHVVLISFKTFNGHR